MPLQSTLRLLRLNKETLAEKRQKVKNMFKSFGKESPPQESSKDAPPTTPPTNTVPPNKETPPTSTPTKGTPPAVIISSNTNCATATDRSAKDKEKDDKMALTDPSKKAEMDITIFEPVKERRPAVVVEKATKMKWKAKEDNTATVPSEKDRSDKKDDGSAAPTSKTAVDSSVKSGSAEMTVFEKVVGAKSRPAVVVEKAAVIKWKDTTAPVAATVLAKDSKEKHKEKKQADEVKDSKKKKIEKTVNQDEATKSKRPQKMKSDIVDKDVLEASKKDSKKKKVEKTLNLDEVAKSRRPQKMRQVVEPSKETETKPTPKEIVEKDKKKNEEFILACRIMVQIRHCNALESVLSRDDNGIVRKFFAEQMENPTPQIIKLLHKAMELCYERIMLHSEEYDIYLDSAMMEFMKNKERAKTKLLDVLMMIPDLLPLMWGGRAVGFQICEDKQIAGPIYLEVQQAVNNDKPKSLTVESVSPWTKMLQNTMNSEADDKKKTLQAPTTSTAATVPPKPILRTQETQKQDIAAFFKANDVKKPK